jgi:hypothetical protein
MFSNKKKTTDQPSNSFDLLINMNNYLVRKCDKKLLEQKLINLKNNLKYLCVLVFLVIF